MLWMPTPEGPSLCWFHVGFLEPCRRGGRRDRTHPALVVTDEGQGSDYRVTGPGRRPPCATHPTEGPHPLGPDRGAWAQQLCPPPSFHQSQMMMLRAEMEEQGWDRTSHLKQTAGSKEQGPEGWEPQGRPIHSPAHHRESQDSTARSRGDRGNQSSQYWGVPGGP